MSVSVSCPFFLNTYAFRWFENFISLWMTILVVINFARVFMMMLMKTMTHFSADEHDVCIVVSVREHKKGKKDILLPDPCQMWCQLGAKYGEDKVSTF